VATGPASVDYTEMVRVTSGQPRANLLFSGRYDQGMLGALVRTQRFGSVSRGDSLSLNTVQDFRAKWITDASVSLKLHRLYTITVGADNLFDVYPDRNNQPGSPTGAQGNGFFGILPYNPVSPFGYSGRFIYGRFSYYL
jgi:iron complex outermembrane receptor protein